MPAASPSLYIAIGGLLALGLGPTVLSGLPSLHELAGLADASGLADALRTSGLAVPPWTAAAISIGAALLYFALWLPFGVCGNCGCASARPLPLADLLILDAADVERGCACTSLLCCAQRTLAAETKPRRRMLKKIATQPLLQLYVALCALAGGILVVACAPRLRIYDADASGTVTFLETAEGLVQKYTGVAALKEIDASVHGAAAQWLNRACCETAVLSRGGRAPSFRSRVCAAGSSSLPSCAPPSPSSPSSPQLQLWDHFCDAALRYAASPLDEETCRRDALGDNANGANATCAEHSRSSSSAELDARAAVTAPWTFLVAIIFNAVFVLDVLLHSSMRLPLAALVAFALLSAHANDAHAAHDESRSLVHVLEHVIDSVKGLARPFLGGAASFVFAFFPALALAARALLPASGHGVAADLLKLHAAWAAQDAARWGRGAAAEGEAGAMPFVRGAMRGAGIGIVLAIAILASTPIKTWRRLKALRAAEASAPRRFAQFCLWPALLFLIATTMGCLSVGTRFVFELRLIATPIAPVLFGLSPIGRLRNTWFIALTVYAWAIGGMHVGVMLPLLLIVLTHHSTQMVLALALLGCCVYLEVGAHLVLLPLLQLLLVPLGVALVRYALRVKLADDVYDKIFFACVHIILVVQSVLALAIGVSVLPSALTATLFCNTNDAAADAAAQRSHYVGPFCALVAVHALHTHVSRLWRAAEKRNATGNTFHEIVRTWAADPPLYLLWLAVAAAQRWTPDLELAVVLECLDVFVHSSTLVLKHHALTAALWHMLTTSPLLDIADGKRSRHAHIALTLPNLKAVAMLAQVVHAASPWGCLPPPLIVVLCAYAMITAAAAMYSAHLELCAFSAVGGDGGVKVQRSIVFWSESLMMRGLCAATLPSHAELSKFEQELRDAETSASLLYARRRVDISLAVGTAKVDAVEAASALSPPQLDGGDTAVAVFGDAVFDRRVLEAEQALKKLRSSGGNVTETRLSQIIEVAVVMGRPMPFEMRIAALLYAHFAPRCDVLLLGDLFFADSMRAYFDLDATHTQALDDVLVSIIGGSPLSGRDLSEYWPPSALAPHLSPVEKLVDGVFLSILERDGVLGQAYREQLCNMLELERSSPHTSASGPQPAGRLVDLAQWFRQSVPEKTLSDHVRVLLPSLFNTARSILLNDSSERESMLRSWFETTREREERERAAVGAAAAAAEAAATNGVVPSRLGTFWTPAHLQKYAPPDIGRALREWALCKVDLVHALERAQNFSAAECERDAAPRADIRSASDEVSGAFKVGLCGSIAIDGVRSHKVALTDCAIFETTSASTYKISNPPSLMEWTELIALWQTYDEERAKAEGTPCLPSRRLYVRPEYLAQRDDRVPLDEGLSALEAQAWLQERWFPARTETGRSIYHQESFKRYESSSSGTKEVYVRYLNELSPVIGSTDASDGGGLANDHRRSLKVKQNQETKVLNQPVFVGEIKIIGLECDLEFESPEDVTIALHDASPSGAGERLDASEANMVSVGIELNAKLKAVTFMAEKDQVEIALFGRGWLGSVTNRIIGTMINEVPFPIVIENVAVRVGARISVVAPAGRDAENESAWNDGNGISLSIDSIVLRSSDPDGGHDLVPSNYADWPLLHTYLFHAIKAFTKKTIYHTRADLHDPALNAPVNTMTEADVDDFCDTVKEVWHFDSVLDAICTSMTDLSLITWLNIFQLREQLRNGIELKRLDGVRHAAVEQEHVRAAAAAAEAAALVQTEAAEAEAAAVLPEVVEAVVVLPYDAVTPGLPYGSAPGSPPSPPSSPPQLRHGASHTIALLPPLQPPPRKVGFLRVAKHSYNLSEWFKLSTARIDGAAVTSENFTHVVPRKYVVLEPRRSAVEPARLCIFRDDPASAGDVLEEIIQPLSLGPRPCAERDTFCFDLEFHVNAPGSKYSFYAESLEHRLYWLDAINEVQREALEALDVVAAAAEAEEELRGGGSVGAARVPPSSPWIRRRGAGGTSEPLTLSATSHAGK